MNNKLSTTNTYNKTQKTTLLHIGNPFLLTGMATIPQIKSNLYSVPGIIVLKFQTDLSTRTKVMAQKSLCLLMYDNDHRPITWKCIWNINIVPVKCMMKKYDFPMCAVIGIKDAYPSDHLVSLLVLRVCVIPRNQVSCICVLGVSIFPASTIFVIGFWNCSDSVVFLVYQYNTTC